MMQLYAHINFGGNCAAAFRFYEQQLGGRVLALVDRSAYLFLAVDSPAEAERVHGVLADGGEVTMPLAETFFATRFSQLRDRFGVLWTIIHEKPRP